MPEPGQIAIFIPIIALMIPIVGMLVRHQQKMAEIMHSSRASLPEVEMLRREVADLKGLVHQQSIEIDSLSDWRKALPGTQSGEGS